MRQGCGHAPKLVWFTVIDLHIPVTGGTRHRQALFSHSLDEIGRAQKL